MALTGTLQDFGITDIFQLIGQQGKSGVLHLRSEDGEEVHISFHNGAVVGAEHVGRRHRELLGRMLVRARLITEKDLSRALETQKRTLRRLGDILVEEGVITREVLREMTQLQVTETLASLFHWKRGTYEFEARDVVWDENSVTPLRSEAVLMEGVRMVDEWPIVRRIITSPKNTFVVLRELPPPEESAGEVDDFSFDDEDGGISAAERRVMELIEPGRTVEELVDLSRLGTFETWKALATLVEQGYIRQLTPSAAEREEGQGRKLIGWLGRRLVALVYGAVVLVLLLGIAAVARSGMKGPSTALAEIRAGVEATRMERARFAVEVFRRIEGRLPFSLAELVAVGLISEGDAARLRHKEADLVVVPLSIRDAEEKEAP